jgi:hypothetical protein
MSPLRTARGHSTGRVLAAAILAVLATVPVQAAERPAGPASAPAAARSRRPANLTRRYAPELKALTDTWVERRNELAKSHPNGAVDDHTYSLRIFPQQGISEPFYPDTVRAGNGATLKRLGVGFGRTVFSLGDHLAVKTTMRSSQAEMKEELHKYSRALRALDRLGDAGAFARERIAEIVGHGEVPASSFEDRLRIGHPVDSRVFIVTERLKQPTLQQVFHQAVSKGGYPSFTNAALAELARIFHEAGRAGILLQGDPADFTFSRRADARGRRFMAIDPAGWLIFSPRSVRDQKLVRYLAAESFMGTFLRELGQVPMPPGSPLPYEPNLYNARNDPRLDRLKAQLARVIDRVFGEDARPPAGAFEHFQAVLAGGDPLRDPYVKEMVSFETTDPQSLATALVHCGIGVVITNRDTLARMHEQRQSASNVLSESGRSGRQIETDLTSLGFGNQKVVVDEQTGLVAVYNAYNAGNPRGATPEERRPHAPWHFVDPAAVAQAVLRHARESGGQQ